MPKFLPGIKLSELYFRKVVANIIKSEFKELKYSAGLLGPGPDVLGYDTARSMDHDWGPRLFLFLAEKDYGRFYTEEGRRGFLSLCTHAPS